nr:hypothetical protein [Tanacetum cinerariifolium]
YGNLSGYGTKGEKACPVCENGIDSRWLTNYRKTIYMGHRRALHRHHPYRKKENLFDGTSEDRSMPKLMDGYATLSQVADLNITFGKKVKAPPKRVPSGYSANIKNLVSMKDLKLLVRQTITKLCLFFNMIHSKVLDNEKLEEMQRDIILILCQLEMYFPPSFFDVMVHLVSYIVEEIKIVGPVFLRIIQGYAAEEVVQFCTNYMDDVTDIGLPQPRHQDKFIGMSPSNVDAYVIQIGYRPRRVLQYQCYDINGYTFYTKKQDDKSTVQNSEVTLIATTTDSSREEIIKDSYYGVIEEFWELDYTTIVIPILNYKWVDNTRSGVKVDNDGFTCVNHSTNGYLSDPFILAKQVDQVFYVEDPLDKRWHIVL